MIKKAFSTLGIVLLLSFASCGGGSKEAKALLQKILQFVGVPQTIVANICQDANRDGVCGGDELFTKVTINKGDDLNDILQKISLTSDGRYFLETYNPKLPILVEFQDIAKVDYDGGKFTLAFNGFETTEDDNETKEVSVLESMVDANALSKEVADKFRTLDNAEAQEKYYTALFNALETNINTLRANEMDSKTAVIATIKEMADETQTNQEQANRINSCENNQTCVDEEIKKLSDELVISKEEVVEIKAEENNSSTPTIPVANEEEVVYYGKWVKPSRSICEENGGRYDSASYSTDSNTKYKDSLYTDCSASWENAHTICSASGGVLPNIETLRTGVTDCGGVVGEYDNNINNKAYQDCFRERGFSPDSYWSSTTDVSDSSYAWAVVFDYGVDYWSAKTAEGCVRCVRGGQ